MENVFETAVKFIEQNRSSDPKTWRQLSIAGASNEIQNVFWWNSEIRLFDIPLINKKTKERSGYLLISESTELPPVIEYATEGLCLKEQVDSLIKPALFTSDFQVETQKYHFMTSTEIYVEVRDQSNDDSFLINVPDLFVVPVDAISRYNRQPVDQFDSESVDEQWYSLDEDDAGGVPQIVLDFAKPTRYQQNCDSYTLMEVCKIDRKEPKTYCSPRRISGCIPVAWAMLLSSWKRMNVDGSDKIWKDSNCWNIEWPSWGGTTNPSKCDEVEKTIWKLHYLMDTSATGGTSDDDTIKGAKIFSSFDLSWKFHTAANQDFSFAQKIIKANQPFLFDGYGKWGFATGEFSDTLNDDKGGHGVVAYGYKKTNKMLLVALGWGTGFANKWIQHEQYSSRGYTYRIDDEESQNSNIYSLDHI